jgi:hypothetical protein
MVAMPSSTARVAVGAMVAVVVVVFGYYTKKWPAPSFFLVVGRDAPSTRPLVRLTQPNFQGAFLLSSRTPGHGFRKHPSTTSAHEEEEPCRPLGTAVRTRGEALTDGLSTGERRAAALEKEKR